MARSYGRYTAADRALDNTGLTPTIVLRSTHRSLRLSVPACGTLGARQTEILAAWRRHDPTRRRPSARALAGRGRRHRRGEGDARRQRAATRADAGQPADRARHSAPDARTQPVPGTYVLAPAFSSVRGAGRRGRLVRRERPNGTPRALQLGHAGHSAPGQSRLFRVMPGMSTRKTRLGAGERLAAVAGQCRQWPQTWLWMVGGTRSPGRQVVPPPIPACRNVTRNPHRAPRITAVSVRRAWKVALRHPTSWKAHRRQARRTDRYLISPAPDRPSFQQNLGDRSFSRRRPELAVGDTRHALTAVQSLRASGDDLPCRHRRP